MVVIHTSTALTPSTHQASAPLRARPEHALKHTYSPSRTNATFCLSHTQVQRWVTRPLPNRERERERERERHTQTHQDSKCCSSVCWPWHMLHVWRSASTSSTFHNVCRVDISICLVDISCAIDVSAHISCAMSHICMTYQQIDMGWLQLVGSLKS